MNFFLKQLCNIPTSTSRCSSIFYNVVKKYYNSNISTSILITRYIIIVTCIIKKFLLIAILISNNSVIAVSKNTSQKKIIQTSLIINASNGRILHARNANKHIFPASLTKVMTLYILFEQINKGKLKMNSKLYVSKYAAAACPSKLYLKAGTTIEVKDAILGLIVKSANDVARVVAENIAGNEDKFARLMTIRARQLGMNLTTFKNASGLHHPQQRTTALDLAKLSIAIRRDFPNFYHYFSHNSFKFRGKIVKGHNPVTEQYPGATGLKTGYTSAAGRNLITSATRGNNSLIGIVTGSNSNKYRNNKMVQLLDKYFITLNNNPKKNKNYKS
ncbi:MAG TPA: D-alanyl-D-alanine carboxypeptidase family protein [Candidatus Megaira endosymbiont of Hartmannula sinica]|nr:D-alanyl-D-alanine carboxypeptidase family protein [Candidatus Megaera endosymbiont of Hartmannula sinica]